MCYDRFHMYHHHESALNTNDTNSQSIKLSSTKRIMHKMSLSVHKNIAPKIIKSMGDDHSIPLLL